MSATFRIGKRDVHRTGFGAMSIERLHDDRAAAVALVRRAVELGVDHVDTAEFYGNGFVNQVIREALGNSQNVLVVSKVGADANPGGRISLTPAQRPEELRRSVDDNLRSLGRERIDVVNLRRLETRPGLGAAGDQIVDLEDQLAVMIAMRDEGKIGDFGISAIGIESLRRALPSGIVCVQNAYSLVDRSAEDLLTLCIEAGVAWVPFFPLGGAFPGLPKVVDEPAVQEVAAALGATAQQVGLAWILARASNTLLIPGTASAQHLAENMAVDAVELSPAAMAALDRVTAPGTAIAGSGIPAFAEHDAARGN